MAINISYQDTTLATFTSGSRVLKTAGKYLVDDITIEALLESGYSLIPVIPEQTVTTSLNTLTNEGISRNLAFLTKVEGERFSPNDYYLTTINNTQWISNCKEMWSSGEYVIGTPQWFLGTSITGEYIYPFAVDDNPELTELAAPAGQYTVQVDRLVFTNSGGGSGGSSGSITLQAKTNITPTTSSQTITADSGYDGLSSVQINAIPNNYVIPTGTKSITTNGTGIDVASYATVDVNVSSGGASPATQHTLYFEFSDNTNTTIPIYCNDSIITTLITDSSPPVSYNGKIISSATFDGTTWYMNSGTWQTLAEGSTNLLENDPTDPPGRYIWLSDLGNVYPLEGSVWRITLFGTTYIEVAHNATLDNGTTTVVIGNPALSGGQDNGSTMPVNFYNVGWGAWVGDSQLPSGSMPFKIEQLVAS